jgi:very-short-patch-repair endonuclease
MDPLRRVTPAQKFALAAKLRRTATPMERHAWSLLRDRGILGLKFRRQHVVHGFIVDFYCAAQRLILELEGDAHDGPDQRAYDAARANVLETAGFRVVRVRNPHVTRAGLEAVLRVLLTSPTHAPP